MQICIHLKSWSTHAQPAASCDATTVALRTCVRWYIYHSQTWNIFPLLYKVPCCFCLRVALKKCGDAIAKRIEVWKI